jgi:multiple sugar transport system substrate-binding protein
MSQHPNRRYEMNRRNFLRWTALSSGALLAACAAPAAPAPSGGMSTAPQVTPTGESLINIAASGAQLPTEPVTFRWIDSGDQKAVFWNQFFDAYQDQHPNITVQYDALPWNEIAQVVPLGVRNNSAHDVFQIPLSYSAAQVVQEGWVAALDDIIPNFEEWKASFPPGVFVPGITDFDGKTYNIPFTSNKRYGSHLLYNVDYMQEAGFDPSEKPLTWDQFREAARVTTENGAGQYYGFIIGGNQVNRWADVVHNFARMAGVSSGDWNTGYNVDFRTGEFRLTDERYEAAIELLLAMRDDGSVFPGVMSMNAPQARAMMPQGAAAMILQGPWNIPIWQAENPDFNFDVSSQPLMEDGLMVPLMVGPGGANQLYVFANAPEANKAIAGDILHYIGTLEGQRAWAGVVGAADGPIFPEALEGADLDPIALKALQMFVEQVRVGPSPLVRNPDVVQVTLELQAVTPNLAETVQGIYTGQIDNIREALQDLNDRSERELDRAIEAARAKGAEVSRDDFVFSNWDPTEDYSAESYAELG